MAAKQLQALSFRGAAGIFRTVGNADSLFSFPRFRRNFKSLVICCAQSKQEKLLVVVGGGAAGIFGAIRAKDVSPHLRVVVIEKGKLLSKVKVSGGGRCNVTNGHHVDGRILAEQYPRGHKELKGSFFKMHGPHDTMAWFNDHGVQLKIEDDGRVFPVSDSSSTIVDCLLDQARRTGVELQIGKVLTHASHSGSGSFILTVGKLKTATVETVESDYLLIATGSSRQGYDIAAQLGHSVVQPMPSLFTFKIEDKHLLDLAGVTFPKVKATLKVHDVRHIPQFVQVGPMLVTHWGLSGPVILRLSAWGARDLFYSNYKGMLLVDFVPDCHMDDVISILTQHKSLFAKQKALTSCPTQLSLVKRFWKYLLERQGVHESVLWSSVPKKALTLIALLMKQFSIPIVGKGQFKDEFVTAGGVPLIEIFLSTMESQKQPGLFFAGEVLNVDGITGGFNFQNAWSGAYIAGTRIGEVASDVLCD
ncbi:unnamed protein product [Victoria cruziana]